LMMQQLVIFSTGLVSQAFVGRLGEFELSVIVLATSVFNATGLIAVMGIAGPMETLCGQVDPPPPVGGSLQQMIERCRSTVHPPPTPPRGAPLSSR